MSVINLNLTDAATNRTRSVGLPGDRPVRDLLNALIPRLQLPVIGPNGEQMVYRLQQEDGTVLGDDDNLTSLGIQEGANITLSAEMEAGK